ncbi:YiiX/YebB-like N1pC/P60 family cysteine hydrolase [Mangrovibacterium marinum]|uniref:YiiX/YebB-like N1pC/P60 family cysteine hydrolase n=1 Tax=Mangrovibacterium marinum TaxID=1639118 RepID=UPI002A18C648|nr:YiiX/YebB-like N1pC/P60 family cysteine hydrolase [Mangrovibacterium marinum]
MKVRLNIMSVVLCIALFSCSHPTKKMSLQSGDLLFQGASSGKLSEAIDKVTQTHAETHFSHVGLVEQAEDGSLWVLHADIEGGCCRVSLNDFLEPDGDSLQTVCYRLKEPWRSAIEPALDKARSMLGLPYNFSYKLSDSSHYCSEFIYKAFQDAAVFKLKPMTFKDPQTGEFFPTWVDYYGRLGIPVPEGEPGCNPNGMAASDKLECLGEYN